MDVIGAGHFKRLKRRADYLREHIEKSDKPLTYERSELAALNWVIKIHENDERNILYRRAYANGQKSVLEFYQKTLKKAVHSGNVEALQFLLDRTNEWLEQAKKTKENA